MFCVLNWLDIPVFRLDTHTHAHSPISILHTHIYLYAQKTRAYFNKVPKSKMIKGHWNPFCFSPLFIFRSRPSSRNLQCTYSEPSQNAYIPIYTHTNIHTLEDWYENQFNIIINEILYIYILVYLADFIILWIFLAVKARFINRYNIKYLRH